LVALCGASRDSRHSCNAWGGIGGLGWVGELTGGRYVPVKDVEAVDCHHRVVSG
jgi:hypothetical protein